MKAQSGIKTALDERISEIRLNTNMSGFLLEPNLVRHIGYRSSLGEEHQKVTSSLIIENIKLFINRVEMMAI